MFGWRGRFGYISPSTFQLPWDLEDLLPDGIGITSTVLNVRSYADSEFQRAQEGVQAAVGVMVGEGAQAVVVAGVPLAVRQGYRREQENLRALSDAAGVPVISSMAASQAGLEHLGVRRVLVATAYPDDHNRLLATYLTDSGLQVVASETIPVNSPAEASSLEPSAFYRLGHDLFDRYPDAQGLFLGARINLLDVAVQLEADLEVPVVHQVAASVWWALGQMKVARKAGSYGRLYSG